MILCKLLSLFLLCAVAGAGFSQASRLIFEANKTSPAFLNLPCLSSVLNDPTDPAATTGLSFIVRHGNAGITASEYELSASSSDKNVISNANIRIEKREGVAILFLSPSGIGYSDIMLTLTYQNTTKTITLHYAVSATSETPAQTVWHTGGSDASAVVPVGQHYMLVADDELDRLFLYNRNKSGLPLSVFYYADKLDLTEGAAPDYKEVDVEAGTLSPHIRGRTYWTGSMSNSAAFTYKPNRDHLFAVDVKDTGINTRCSIAGNYDNLRQQLINWGNGNNYKFGKSAATGQNPKTDDGFNIEAMAFAPDSTTLYIGFRAPLVPFSDRKKAVIAPIQNFEAWFNNGRIKSKPVIGAPVELNLGGRGIRDMIRLSNGMYIILAGSSGEARTGAVYKWTGNAADSPVLLPGFDISRLNAEAVLEVDDEGGNLVPDKLEVLSDNGTAIYYNDNREAKGLGETSFRKFRSDIIISPLPLLNP